MSMPSRGRPGTERDKAASGVFLPVCVSACPHLCDSNSVRPRVRETCPCMSSQVGLSEIHLHEDREEVLERGGWLL
jgi:hypothetical protein